MIAATYLMKNGYDVFMNHGRISPVDIVAIKDKKVHLFDVKSKMATNGYISLSKYQIELGVRLILVSGKGRCKILNVAYFKWGTKNETPCEQCGKFFMNYKAGNRSQRFCSKKCLIDSKRKT